MAPLTAEAFANAGRNDPCPCGSGKKFKKCCMEKVPAQPRQSAPSQQAAALLNQASQLLNSGNLQAASQAISAVLKQNPRQADALNLQAYIYQKQQAYELAEQTVAAAIAINPDNGLFYLNQAVILRLLHKYEPALQSSHKALALAPKPYHAQIHLNIANCLQEMKDTPASLEQYDKALARDDKLALAWFGRGVSYYELGDMQRMQANFDKAIELEPNNPATLQKIGSIYLKRKDYQKSLELLDAALSLAPDFDQANILRAQTLLAMGKADEVLELYASLRNKYPNNPALPLLHAFVMPIMYRNNEEIDAWRTQIFDRMEKILQHPPLIERPETHALELPFYQGYHGRDNTGFMKKLAQLFSASCPGLNFTAPHCIQPPAKKERLKIGFLAESFDSTLLTQFYGELIERLAEHADFDVVIFAHTGNDSDRTARLQSAVQHYVRYPTHLQSAQQIIAAQQLDMLIYLEIGMQMMSYMLAFARLAPVQAVLHGHPITSGIPTMDYFFSVDGMEIENAQEHYSETLIRFEKNYSIFQQRHIPDGSKTRAELGLPDGDVRLYSCPAVLFRLHPDMDGVFRQILQEDEKAQIVCFGAEQKEQVAFLQNRFAEHIGALSERIHFVPYAKGDDFIYCLRAMDALLDPLHFSLGTTVFLALGAGVPFITHSGPFLRERAATYHFNRLGITELITHSHQDYAQKAIKLANDKGFYQSMQCHIIANNSLLYDTEDTADMFAAKLKTLMNNE